MPAAAAAPAQLSAPVEIAWPLPAVVPDVTRAQVFLWLSDHGDTEDLHRIILGDRLHVWRLRVPFADPFPLTDPGVIRREIVGPAEIRLRWPLPASALADLADSNALTCTAALHDDTGAGGRRCNVGVDRHGRHLADHADGRLDGGQMTWPNGNPADAPLPAPPTPIVVPSRAAIRVVLALALNLCNHLPDAADTCPHCPGIDRATTAVLAMIGDPA